MSTSRYHERIMQINPHLIHLALLDRARLASVNLCTHIASLCWEAVDNICTCTHHIIIKVILKQVFFLKYKE